MEIDGMAVADAALAGRFNPVAWDKPAYAKYKERVRSLLAKLAEMYGSSEVTVWTPSKRATGRWSDKSIMQITLKTDKAKSVDELQLILKLVPVILKKVDPDWSVGSIDLYWGNGDRQGVEGYIATAEPDAKTKKALELQIVIP